MDFIKEFTSVSEYNSYINEFKDKYHFTENLVSGIFLPQENVPIMKYNNRIDPAFNKSFNKNNFSTIL